MNIILKMSIRKRERTKITRLLSYHPIVQELISSIRDVQKDLQVY